MINAYDYTENMGMMPVPNNSGDGTNEKLVGGGSKYFFIDSSENTSDAQRQAARDFLNWLVYDEAGQSFVVNDCALDPAYSNITLTVGDPLGTSVKAYSDAGSMIDNYNYLPDDHYSICGAAFQKYLAGQIDRAGLADELTTYWATASISSSTPTITASSSPAFFASPAQPTDEDRCPLSVFGDLPIHPISRPVP